MDAVLLQTALDSHLRWRRGEPGFNRTSLANQDLSNSDFSGMDLSDIDFGGANLTNAKFIDCTLNAVRFKDANLANADFTNAIVTMSNFVAANCTNTVFTNTNLFGSDFSQVNITGCSFTTANTTNVDLGMANTRVVREDFYKTIQSASLDDLRTLWHLLNQGKDASELIGRIASDAQQPCRVWLAAIKPGDTEHTNKFVEQAMHWLDIEIRQRLAEDAGLAENLLGKTLVAIQNNENCELVFTTENGQYFKMWHEQDCCEWVEIEDIAGDLDDLLHSPLTMAEVSSNSDDPPKKSSDDDDDYVSYTWTFYKFATIKGYVTIRWYGASTGYYSEEVNFREMTPAEALEIGKSFGKDRTPIEPS